MIFVNLVLVENALDVEKEEEQGDGEGVLLLLHHHLPCQALDRRHRGLGSLWGGGGGGGGDQCGYFPIIGWHSFVSAPVVINGRPRLIGQWSIGIDSWWTGIPSSHLRRVILTRVKDQGSEVITDKCPFSIIITKTTLSSSSSNHLEQDQRSSEFFRGFIYLLLQFVLWRNIAKKIDLWN